MSECHDRVLGRLEEFKQSSEKRFDTIEKKIDHLNEFRWKIAGIMLALSVVLSVAVEIIHKVKL